MRRITLKLAAILVVALCGLSRVSPASACDCGGFGCLTADCDGECSVVDCLCGYAGCTCEDFCLDYSPMCVWGRSIADCGGFNCPCDYHCQSWPCTPCSYMTPDPCGCPGEIFGCDCEPKCTETVWQRCQNLAGCTCGDPACGCCPNELCPGKQACTCGGDGCNTTVCATRCPKQPFPHACGDITGACNCGGSPCSCGSSRCGNNRRPCGHGYDAAPECGAGGVGCGLRCGCGKICLTKPCSGTPGTCGCGGKDCHVNCGTSNVCPSSPAPSCGGEDPGNCGGLP